jgi:CCR4-NOT transcriptional regulation complex NOT5 subunit
VSEKIGTQMLQSAAAHLNPQFHDEFVALSALYYSGEISEEEWALLQIHMGYCDSCHEKFLEYQRITSDVIPALAAAAASELSNAPRESDKSLKDAEQRLMGRLNSAPSEDEPSGRPKLGWHLSAAWIAATCGLVLACVFGVQLARMKSRPDATATQTPASPRTVPATGGPPAQDLQQALKRSQDQVASPEQQVTAENGKAKQASLALAGIEKQFETEQNVQEQLREEKDKLSRQLVVTQTELDGLRSKWATAGTDAAQQSERTSALETQVRELKAALEDKDVALSEKDRMLALDKDFLSRDRDIRDLIGARNLYIADILDTNENGRTAKQFGRIFYTRDRSLIFYGFDLDSQAGRKQDVSFQVWGSGSDRPSPVSLGLFYQDDNHKRWVLRCNDAKALARLDMVFVTIEPPGGSPKPTGKQLLRAYLQIHPNHP